MRRRAQRMPDYCNFSLEAIKPAQCLDVFLFSFVRPLEFRA